MDKGHLVAEVSSRLGVSQHSVFEWFKQFAVPEAQRTEASSQQEDIWRLKSELRRVTEERDILIKAAAYFAKESR